MSICTKCDLYKTCTSVKVGGDGSLSPKVLLVGRDPGTEEDKVGKPFVGKSGKLLRATLEELEFPPDDIRFTNLVRCHTPDDEGPTAAQIAACSQYLEDEVREVGPEVIVLLGQDAAHSVLRVKDKMSSMRGRPHTVSIGGADRTVFVTHHPARLLRTPSLLGEFAQDLQIVKEFCDGTLSSADSVEVVSIRTEEELSRLVDDVLASGAPFAFDIETTNTYPYHSDSRVLCIGLSFEPDRAYVIPYSYGYPNDGEDWTAEVVDAWMDVARPHIERLLRGANPKVGHNVKFDALYLDVVLGIWPLCLEDDTVLLHYCLDERIGTHGLDQLAPIVGMAGYDDVISAYHSKGGGGPTSINRAPWDILSRYNGLDCVCTYRLWRELRPRVHEDKDAKRVYEGILKPSMLCLVDIQRNGAAVDTAALPVIQRDLEDTIRGIEESIQGMDFVDEFMEKYAAHLEEKREAAAKKKRDAQGPAYEKWVEDGKPPEKFKWAKPNKVSPEEILFDAGSSTKLGFALFDVLGLSPIKRSKKTDAPSTDEDTLNALAEMHELPALVLELRANRILLNTYWGMLNDYTVDGLLHPAFHMHTTATGRLSSSGPPLQNFPKKTVLRKAFVSRFGGDGVLVQADLSQAELRVMAALSGDPVLSSAFTSDPPLDVHTLTASEAFGIPFDRVNDDARRKAKSVNFGIIYGITQVGLARQLGVSQDEAGDYIRQYLNKMRGVAEYMERVKRYVKSHQCAKSKLGRVRHLPDVQSSDKFAVEEAYRQGINHTIQSPASDWTLLSAVELHYWLRKHKMRSVIWNLVHDSIVLDVPIDELAVVAPKAKEVLERKRFDWMTVPMVADVEVGTSWHPDDLEKVSL